MTSDQDEITRLLHDWGSGNPDALNELMPLVHVELRRTARAYLRREKHAESWQSTMLVNEVFLRLMDCRRVGWQDREHFFRLAAKKMRHILIDYARKKRLQKSGADFEHVPIRDEAPVASRAEDPVDLILLDTALEQLEQFDPRKAQIVEMRFFGGMTVQEIANVLGLALSTVNRDLHLAKVWLFRSIRGRDDDGS